MKKDVKGDFVYEDEAQTTVVFKPSKKGKFTIRKRTDGETTMAIDLHKAIGSTDEFNGHIVCVACKKSENEIKK